MEAARTLRMRLTATLRALTTCLAAITVGTLAPPVTSAQTCGPQWLPGQGVDGSVNALATWDPDGPGPQTQKVVVGGQFALPGGGPRVNLAVYDPTGSWSLLGSGMTGNPLGPSVRALAVLPGGDLVAGGFFASVGGIPTNNIARWNGSFWSPLGPGLDGGVTALAVLANGDLIAARGTLGTWPSGVARWNGTTWTGLGSGLTGGQVYVLAVLPNGDLIAGGGFTHADGQPARGIALWAGVSWTSLGDPNGDVYALAPLPNGDAIVGGSFTRAGGVDANYIARLRGGGAWSALGTGTSGFVYTVTGLSNDHIVAGGAFLGAGGSPANFVAKWDGASWSPLGSGTDSTVQALSVLSNGELAAGGGFTTAGGIPAAYFARYSFTGLPTVSVQPRPLVVEEGQAITVTATLNSGYAGVAFQWRRNGVDVGSGPGGASPGGGLVSDASGALASPTNGTSTTLTVAGAKPSDSGSYAAVFISPCGSVTTQAAEIVVTPTTGACCGGTTCSVTLATACTGTYRRFVGLGTVCNAPGITTTPCCRSDFTQDGVRSPADIFAFLDSYFSNVPATAALTDFDGSGTRQPADIFAFLNAYFSGC